MIDYYQSQKLEKKRKRKAKIFFALFLFILLIIIGGVTYFFRSPYSKLKEINVNVGNQDKTFNDNLISLYNSDANGGKYFFEKIFGQNSIFTPIFYSSDIINSIEKDVPEIKNVQITTGFLSRSVSINGSMRDKFGLWCLDGKQSAVNNSSTSLSLPTSGQATSSGLTSSSSSDYLFLNPSNSIKCFWFDSDGVAFMEGPDTEGQLIYKVMDSYDNNINIGQTILRTELIKNIILDFNFLDKTGLGYKILYLSDPSLEEIHTDTSIKPVIYFSLRNDPGYALDAFLKYKSDFIKSGYVDLRIPNRIYYK